MSNIAGNIQRHPWPHACALLVAFVATAAQAKPPSEEALAIYRQFNETLNATPTWHTKPMPTRLQAKRDADALVQRAERVWGDSPGGPGASCRAAAISHKFYVIDLNDQALVVEGRRQLTHPSDLAAPMYKAVGFGEQKAACLAYLSGSR